MLGIWDHFTNMSERERTYGALQSTMLRRIRAKGVAWAFTPGDFADLGAPDSVSMTLTRLSRRGTVKRVRRGIYEIPHSHPIAGTVGATTEAIADAIARRDGFKRFPSGAAAANELGLSTQVAARKCYGVGPRSRTVRMDDATNIHFSKRSGKVLALTGRASGYLAEALRNLGRDKIRKADLKALRSRMNARDRRQLKEDLRFAPAWMRPIFLEVAQDD
jgi:hypothetical protein